MGYGFGGFLNIIFLLALGALGVSSIIVKKKPNAKELIDKLARVGGIIGLIAALWGIYGVVSSLMSIGWLSYWFLAWLTSLATSLVFVGLGFLFGYPLLASVMSEQAKAKAETVRQKVAGYQVLMGWVALGLAAWWLVVTISPSIVFSTPMGALARHLR